MNYKKISPVLLLMSFMIGIMNAQTEVNPTDIKFGVNTKLEFNNPNLDITNNAINFTPPATLVSGAIRYISGSRHTFYWSSISNPLLSIEYNSGSDEGEINRPSTGTSDLLPYAYGTVCKAVGISLAVEDDSGNFSATSGANYLQIDFNDNVAQDIVFVFSPYSCGGLTQATQGSARPMGVNSTRVTMFQPDGSTTSEIGISFVAYKK